MSRITLKQPEDNTTPVKNLQKGEHFIFPGTLIEDAVNNDDGSLVYGVLELTEKKQVEIVSLDLKTTRKIVEETPVLKVDVDFVIDPCF